MDGRFVTTTAGMMLSLAFGRIHSSSLGLFANNFKKVAHHLFSCHFKISLRGAGEKGLLPFLSHVFIKTMASLASLIFLHVFVKHFFYAFQLEIFTVRTVINNICTII